MRYLPIALAVFALDQLSKAFVRAVLVPGERLPVLPPILYFTYVENPGAAFGLFADHQWLFIGLGTAALAFLIVYRKTLSEQTRCIQLGVALAAGGSLGNLIDRIRWGSVADFVDITIWPIFNIADVCIVLGVALLMREVIRYGR